MADAAAPETPKMSLKMLVMPAMFFLSKKVDLKDPEVLQIARIGFIGSVLMLSLMYGYIYMKIQSSTDNKEVWFPPAPSPSAWMLKLMGQEDPEANKPYKKSTMKDHGKSFVT